MKLKLLYKKHQEIDELKKQLKEKEECYKKLLDEIIAMYPEGYEEDNYILLRKEKKTRKITDPRKFINSVGDVGWYCLTVAIQKIDALKLTVPDDIVETTISYTYNIKKKDAKS